MGRLVYITRCHGKADQEWHIDFIGAARPLSLTLIPNKINEDRIEDIRECIGCNICHQIRRCPFPAVQKLREEWRKTGIQKPSSQRDSDKVLFVGLVPLVWKRRIGLRGHEVVLAEGSKTLGTRRARAIAAKSGGLGTRGRLSCWPNSENGE